jgi:hypothetical protein
VAKQIVGPKSKVLVNGTDLSAFCTSFTVEDSADEVDVTGFGEIYREFIPGLKDANSSGDFLVSYGSGEVDAVIGAQYYADATGTIKITPDTSGTVVYTLVNKVYSYNPFAGAVGEANSTTVAFRNASTAGLTRGTA